MSTNSRLRSRGFAWLPMCLIIAAFTAGGLLLASAVTSPTTKVPERKYVTKNIEDVKVGDWVLAKDPGQAGPPTPHQVMALPRNYTLHIVHVQVEGGGEVQATRNHPFYVDRKGWTEARDLRVGDRLRDEHDCTVIIERLWTEDRQTDTYNLTVEGVHTYYVLAGGFPLLVHNLNPWDFGNYNDLSAQSSGDDLHIHHYPQATPAEETIPGYDRQAGLAVAVPSDQHMGMNGSNYRSGEFQGSAKDLIDEAKQNMQQYTDIPKTKLGALDREARKRYLGCD
jgi:hypothetical protein